MGILANQAWKTFGLNPEETLNKLIARSEALGSERAKRFPVSAMKTLYYKIETFFVEKALEVREIVQKETFSINDLSEKGLMGIRGSFFLGEDTIYSPSEACRIASAKSVDSLTAADLVALTGHPYVGRIGVPFILAPIVLCEEIKRANSGFVANPAVTLATTQDRGQPKRAIQEPVA